MTDAQLPGAVRTLIARHIESVQQVEILRLLRADPRPWPSAETATALRIAPETCAAWLELLARAALVERADGGYRYCAGPAGDELLACYALRRPRVVSAIHGPQ
jgi:DNA-binding IclR family transcriptional regulator